MEKSIRTPFLPTKGVISNPRFMRTRTSHDEDMEKENDILCGRMRKNEGRRWEDEEKRKKNSACLEKDREDHDAGTSSRKNMKRGKNNGLFQNNNAVSRLHQAQN